MRVGPQIALAVRASAALGRATKAARHSARVSRRSGMSWRLPEGAVGRLSHALVGHESRGQPERVRCRLIEQAEPSDPGRADLPGYADRSTQPGGLCAPADGEVERAIGTVGRDRELRDPQPRAPAWVGGPDLAGERVKIADVAGARVAAVAGEPDVRTAAGEWVVAVLVEPGPSAVRKPHPTEPACRIDL